MASPARVEQVKIVMELTKSAAEEHAAEVKTLLSDLKVQLQRDDTLKVTYDPTREAA